MSRFVGWLTLTLTHTQRWHARRHSAGCGHVYQGRFKSFPIQEDEHFYSVARYVERNALRANLAPRAEEWRWGSLFRWQRASAEDRRLLAAWPLPRRPGWLDHVNAPQTELELLAIRAEGGFQAQLSDHSLRKWILVPAPFPCQRALAKRIWPGDKAGVSRVRLKLRVFRRSRA